jgi:Conserved TM helix
MTGDLSRGLSDMWRSVLMFVPTALAFVAILVIGYFLARIVRTLVAKALHRVGFDRAVESGVRCALAKSTRATY